MDYLTLTISQLATMDDEDFATLMDEPGQVPIVYVTRAVDALLKTRQLDALNQTREVQEG